MNNKGLYLEVPPSWAFYPSSTQQPIVLTVRLISVEVSDREAEVIERQRGCHAHALWSLLWFSQAGRIDTGKRDKFKILTKCGIGQFEFYRTLGQESGLWCLVSGPVVFWTEKCCLPAWQLKGVTDRGLGIGGFTRGRKPWLLQEPVLGRAVSLASKVLRVSAE